MCIRDSYVTAGFILGFDSEKGSVVDAIVELIEDVYKRQALGGAARVVVPAVIDDDPCAAQ